MPLALSLTVIPCALIYFRRVRVAHLREGILLGALWWVISVLIDLPLMLSPPVSYTLVKYGADVALTYLMMPAITVGIALAAAGNTTWGSRDASGQALILVDRVVGLRSANHPTWFRVVRALTPV